MKNLFNFKWLLLCIVLSIASVSQIWAYNGIRLRSDYYTGGWSYTSDIWTYGGDGYKYWDVYHTGADSYWRIRIDYYNSDYCPNTANYELDGPTGYKVVKGGHNAFKTHGDPGILRIVAKQFDDGASDEYPNVWVERPGVQFKHNWNGGSNDGDWTWTPESGEGIVTDNHDGTYTYRNTYGGTIFFNAKSVNGAEKVAKTTTNIVGSPTTGDRCEFKWEPTGYKHIGEEEDNRGIFTITKLITVTYDDNSSTGGSVPSNQEELYEETFTLATNSGSLERTGYVFTGWNTAANGSGDHYDEEESIELTDDLVLYAEWEEVSWSVKGGESSSASESDDKMGNWSKDNNLKKVSENLYQGTITLDAGKVYYFKVYNKANGDEYGKEYSYNNPWVFVGQSNSQLMSTSTTACRIATGNAGEYTFEFNGSTHYLTIQYPSGDKHPSTNFVYWNNPSTWYTIKGHIYQIGESTSTLTSWDDSPELSTTTIGGNTYYFAAIGDRERIIFRGEQNYGANWYQTINLVTASSHKGQYNTNGTSGSESWSTFSVDITLNHQNGTSNTVKSVAFNSEVLSTVSKPSKNGYAFAGYYTAENGGGTQIIDGNGDWITSVSGYTDASGHWILDGGTATLYAKWTPVDLTFDGGDAGTGTDWSTASNWEPACVPTAAHDVIIEKPVVVATDATAYAKSIVIDKYDGATGKLTINPGGALILTNSINKKNAEGTTGSTESDDLLIKSNSSKGNGALVWGLNAGSPGSTPGQATVEFYTLAKLTQDGAGNDLWVNQLIGTPFSTDANWFYNYYYCMILEHKAEHNGDYPTSVEHPEWLWITGNKVMSAFKGYDLLCGYDTENTKELTGVLATNANQTLALSHYNNAATDNIFANSWTAPIDVSTMEVADFGGADATIYMFNSGTPEEEVAGGGTAGASTTKTSAGQYVSLPVKTANWTTGASITVIPSMQGFLVKSASAGNRLTLNYDRMVKTPASASKIAPNRAPKHEENKPDILRLRVADTKGWSDNVCVLIREDFAPEFENGYDARKVGSLEDYVPMLYAASVDGNMSVNCVPTADNNVFGFRPAADGEHTFSFSYDGEDDLYLVDTKTNIETPINEESSYKFSASSEDSELRFIVIKKSKETATGIDNTNLESHVQKIMHNGMMYIIRGGRMYNAEGALVK